MPEDIIKYFGLNNFSIEADLERVENHHGISIKPRNKVDIHDGYYPQIPENIRNSARKMAEHYELFYCVELSIRDLIRAQLEAASGPEWWEAKVPANVKENANRNKQKELQSGVTPRSSDILSYTNFGELGEIIKANWDVFGQIFTDVRAVELVLARLNGLRAPIAHCSMLAEDEVLRLRLSLRDWYRLME